MLSQGISIFLSGSCSTMDRLEYCETLAKASITRQDANRLNGREACSTVVSKLQMVTVINLLFWAVCIAEMLVLLIISTQSNDKKRRYSRHLVLPSGVWFVVSFIISFISLLYMFPLSFVAVVCKYRFWIVSKHAA